MAAVRESDVFGASQVRVFSAEGEVVGAGFLVAADVVCTCAHVVARALGVPDSARAAPGEPVDLDFPLLEGRPRTRATVVSWRPGGQDTALLRLETAVEGTRPVKLVDGTGVWGHTFRALGYPSGADRGVWASGTLRAGQGSGWVQMEAQEPGPRISGGFSGSPVWDDAQDGVVGMTVAAHVGERTAYLLPSADLVDEETLRSRCPFQGLAPFSEVDAEFFHGRASDIARVCAAVRKRPVTLVAGPSGCGKSSLVGAGVLPRLRSGGMGVSEVRPVPGVRASAVLARVLTDVLQPGLGEIERLAGAEQLARLLDTGDGVPAELRSRILARSGEAGHVLFVDQFEEYAAAEAAAARDLLELLAALAGKEGAAVLRVVATARPDSLDVLVTAVTSDLVSDAVEFLAPLAAEGLEQAVAGPVDDMPGLWFEPGLPERIVADAGDEPGRMTLVQFALTELWGRRSRSMLTHAAYDELGGVAGALVGYADDTLDGLTPSRRELARRLFVQLARPDGDAFLRRPTRAADLTPELIELARELAPSKLIVLSRGPGGAEEIVDLAHEALTRLWPRLQRWLADSRDFRAWQEQLRADLRRWQAQQRESPRLLSGTDLAEAERRLAAQPDDISVDERGYVLLSRRHSRRGARIRKAALGALSVLTALALILAWFTVRSLRETEEQLRIQAAALLAQAAEDTPGSNPATALQLSLAAWSIQQTPKTRDALMHQYARGQYLVGAYPSVWKGQFQGMEATADGRTLVVASKPSGGDVYTFTVVTGVLEGKIRASELGGVSAGGLATALSPDGSLFALAARDSVRLWRLNDGKGGEPVVLDRGEHGIAEEPGASLDFSSDGKRLLLTTGDLSMDCYKYPERCVPSFAEAWEVHSGDRLPVADSLVAGLRLSGAAFTTDSDAVAVTYWGKDVREVAVKDLVTGRELYRPDPPPESVSSSAPLVRSGGEVALSAVGGRPYAQALGRTAGPGVALPDTSAYASVDVTGNYGVEGTPGIGEVKEGGYVESTLTDVRTGQVYRTRVPTAREISNGRPEVAAVPRADGTLTVLVPVGTTLMALRAERSGHERFRAGDQGRDRFALSPDGNLVARLRDNSLEVLDASRTVLQSVEVPAPGKANDSRVTWTADSQAVVVWERDAGLQRAYEASDLRQSVPLPREAQKGEKVESIVGVQGREIVLLTENGTLARLDATRGTVLTQPFLAHPGPNTNGLGSIFVKGLLMARPSHPGQVAVVTRAGSALGEVLLWDVRAPEQVATLTGPAVSAPPFGQESDGSSLAFNRDGSRLAVQNSDGTVRIWDVDRRERLREEVPRPTLSHLIGFTPDGGLVMYLNGLIRVHDLTNGSFVTLAVAESSTEEITDTTARLTSDSRLVIDNKAGRRAFDLRPEAQFRTLCAGAGRDYTKDERKLLPKGTPSKPPCS
ncbi:trypsin-like peptidase domain-containing protein [Kitasatospora sp. NPDC048239]|uniref:nSTAND1 domain-containing NTPase n=1 Tax=Kitasatospora sp. NPDC048239 TaxID=3364046 RepID=UPI00371E31B8